MKPDDLPGREKWYTIKCHVDGDDEKEETTLKGDYVRILQPYDEAIDTKDRH